jgi:hypothetical protein
MEEFRTTDFGLASYILYHDNEVKLEPMCPGRFNFVFSLPHEKIRELVSGYWGGNCQVHARKYFNSTKELKNYMYNT